MRAVRTRKPTNVYIVTVRPMAFQVTISFAAVVTKVTRIPDRINIMHIRFVPFQTISGRCRLLTPWHIAYEDFFFRSRYTKLFSPAQQRFLGRHPLLWELYETHNRNTPRSARNTETSLLIILNKEIFGLKRLHHEYISGGHFNQRRLPCSLHTFHCPFCWCVQSVVIHKCTQFARLTGTW